MTGWFQSKHGYWSLSAQDTLLGEQGVSALQIHPVDSHTEHECSLYGVEWNPSAKFAFYIVHQNPPEDVIESLHLDLESAKAAGLKRLAGGGS